MKIFRALLFVATLVVTATCPLVWALFGWAAGDHSSAAVGGATTALAANDNSLNNVNFNVSNDNGNGNRHHGNDNGVFTGVESIASGPDCDAGHERVIGAANGKVQLKLPTGTNQHVRVNIRWPVDRSAYPPLPDALADNLMFEVQAQVCNSGGLLTLEPANLSVTYSDADVVGLDRQKLAIMLYDPTDLVNPWKPVVTSTVDPSGKSFVSATILRRGVYALAIWPS